MTAPIVPTAPLPSLDLTKYEGHTPGPWSTRKYGVIIGGVVREYVNGSSQDQIAMACNVQDDNGGALAMERNTLLMGDAPQLLAALLTMQRERDQWKSRANIAAGIIETATDQLAASERTCAEFWEALLKWKLRAEAAERTNNPTKE